MKTAQFLRSFLRTRSDLSDLPHGLVKAFLATLEEVLEADLILIVIDAASEHAVEHTRVVEEVLKELGAESRKKLFVLNKADLLCDEEKARLRDAFPEALLISAAQNHGTRDLIATIRQVLMPPAA